MVRAHTIGKAVRGRLCAPESPIWGACTRLLKCAGGDRQDYGIRPVAGNRPAVPNLKKIAPVGSIGGDLPRKGRRSGESHRLPLNRRVVTIAVRQVGRSLGRFVQRSGVIECTSEGRRRIAKGIHKTDTVVSLISNVVSVILCRKATKEFRTNVPKRTRIVCNRKNSEKQCHRHSQLL